ncbi:HAD family hydrolase [Chloroflexota bacterium]
MKYKAVIFDLYGTLVDEYPYEGYQSVLGQMASIFKISFDDFKRLWYETADERNTGILRFVEDNVEYICQKLGVPADDTKVKHATRLRYDFVAETMKPRQDAVEVLSQLRSRGLKLGLISNCSPETPVIWEDTSFPPLFNVTVFSSSAGVKKPDPRIYQLAVERLAVNPESCLYIGDGDSNELTGALSAGMHPVMIRIADEDSAQPHVSIKQEWDGLVISSLKEILALIE